MYVRLHVYLVQIEIYRMYLYEDELNWAFTIRAVNLESDVTTTTRYLNSTLRDQVEQTDTTECLNH